MIPSRPHAFMPPDPSEQGLEVVWPCHYGAPLVISTSGAPLSTGADLDLVVLILASCLLLIAAPHVLGLAPI